MSRDILEVIKEVMEERTSETTRMYKIATLKLYLGYLVKVLDLILDIHHDRQYRRYDW